MVVERLFVPELSKVDEHEKKVCAIAVTHLLCDPQSMISGAYCNSLWLTLLQALLKLFESSNQLQTMSAAERRQQAQEQAEEELLVGLDDTPGSYRLSPRHSIWREVSLADYTPAFSRLAFAKKTPTDIFGSSIADARYHLAKCLHTLTASQPNQVRRLHATVPAIRPSFRSFSSYR